MTIEQYRARPEESFSSLKFLLQSGLHFQAAKIKGVEPTSAMRSGTIVDEAVLSGIRRPVVVMPPEIAALTGKGSRTAKTAWKAAQEASGAEICTEEEAEDRQRMISALDASADFQGLLRICPERQKPVFFTYRDVKLKALLDMAGRDAGGHRCFADLKTSSDGSPRGFGRLAYSRDYDLQIVMYQTALAMEEGLETPPLPCWAVVENSAAAPVSLFAIPDEALRSGQRKLDLVIDRYKEGTETGIWKGYGSGWLMPDWPRYANE